MLWAKFGSWYANIAEILLVGLCKEWRRRIRQPASGNRRRSGCVERRERPWRWRVEGVEGRSLELALGGRGRRRPGKGDQGERLVVGRNQDERSKLS